MEGGGQERRTVKSAGGIGRRKKSEEGKERVRRRGIWLLYDSRSIYKSQSRKSKPHIEYIGCPKLCGW